MHSRLAEDVDANTMGKRLRKKHNVIFLLRESNTIIIIPDDGNSHLSDGMDKEAAKLP